MNTQRLLPLSGIGFVVLALAGIVGVGGDTPDAGASGETLSAFYGSDTWRQVAAAFVLTASLPLLLLFTIELSNIASSAERRVSAKLVLAGGTVLASVLAITAMVHFALADAGDKGFSGDVLQALNALDGETWVAFNAGLGITMLGAGGCLWTAAGAQRWLGRIALLLGTALFVPFASFVALLLSLIWIVVVALIRSRAGAGSREAVPAPAAA